MDCRGRCVGFTLVEMLVTISIIAVLLALMLPGVFSALAASRRHACMMNLRRTTTDFIVFADTNLGTQRGDDEKTLPKGQFLLSTFVESQYEIHEFWTGGSGPAFLPLSQEHPLRCPDVKTPVLLSNGPCTGGAGGGISPPAGVSYGFNMRLHKRPPVGSAPSVGFIRLKSSILQQPGVPLVWDHDAASLASRGISDTSFSAPTLTSTGPYAGDRYWSPASRHARGMNVAFIDGHAEHTTDPLRMSNARWDHVPR